MSENQFAYFDSIVAHRSLMLNDEEALAGGTLVSLETVGDIGQDDLYASIQENFPQFLNALRTLSAEDQEILLSYYVLGKTQVMLGKISGTTQTICSSNIRMAVKRLATYIAGGLSQSELARILSKSKLEDSLPDLALSKAITLYEETRSFQYIAQLHNLHRPDIRRAMREAAKQLLESKDDREQMVGAYIFGLVDKASASGQGLSKRKMEKQCHFYMLDPECLGQFRIRIENPGADAIFTSRASR